MTPRTATTLEELAELERDNVYTNEFWMLTDGATVSITEQRPSEQAKSSISIPQETFNRFIDWYNTGEWKEQI